MSEKIDFDKIIEIRRVREEIEELAEYERSLSSPKDFVNVEIADLYELFNSIVQDKEYKAGEVALRKKFIFIVLYILAPGVLAGDKMPRKLRGRISEVLNIKSQTTISNNCADLIFLYQNYKSFQREVSDIFSEMVMKYRAKKSA